MTVTPEDRDAMARLLSIMDGTPAVQPSHRSPMTESNSGHNELLGPGQISRAEVDAMAGVLERFNSVSNGVVNEMIAESRSSPIMAEALETERNRAGVKVGRYQIMIKEDSKRLAGKQFYSVYNSSNGDTIADDISLYETALTVVRLLNSGKFANSPEVRNLFAHDDAYTAHRVDALLYKQKYMKSTDLSKKDIFESRYQASLDRCMSAKKAIKVIANGNNHN